MLTNAYIDIGEYVISLILEYPDETGHWIYKTTIARTGKKPPPIDPKSLEGRQLLWILSKMTSKPIGDFPIA